MNTEPTDIWLDDERDPADHGCAGYLWIKTASDLVAWIERHGMSQVRYLSLDHDLGAGWTGYDVMLWLEERVSHGDTPPRSIGIHTQNPAGKERMRAVRYSLYRLAEKGAR